MFIFFNLLRFTSSNLNLIQGKDLLQIKQQKFKNWHLFLLILKFSLFWKKIKGEFTCIIS